MAEPTIFERILSGAIPVKFVYEDEHVVAFDDISPQAPVHVLVIPRRKLVNVTGAGEGDAELLGHVLLGAQKVARLKGIADSGYRLVLNNGSDGGQTVPYLHCHVLGGRAMEWPPG